jgi:hypothetical protein
MSKYLFLSLPLFFLGCYFPEEYYEVEIDEKQFIANNVHAVAGAYNAAMYRFDSIHSMGRLVASKKLWNDLRACGMITNNEDDAIIDVRNMHKTGMSLVLRVHKNYGQPFIAVKYKKLYKCK